MILRQRFHYYQTGRRQSKRLIASITAVEYNAYGDVHIELYMPDSSMGYCEARFETILEAEQYMHDTLLQEMGEPYFSYPKNQEFSTTLDYFEEKFGQVYGRISKKVRLNM